MRLRRMWALLALVAVPLSGAAEGAASPDPVAAWREAWPSAPLVTNLAHAPQSGPLRFESSTPASQSDALRLGATHPAQVVAAQLRLPEPAQQGRASGRRLPAVVLMHGSGGVYSALLNFWPSRLAEAGFATLVVDAFGPRGVRSTAEDQSLVPREADLADAFAALRLLATDPRIDRQRIAIMGFSRGGATTWRAAVQPLAQALAPSGERFAAHIPIYSGGCAGLRSMVVTPGLFGPAPMLWIHGGADDYAPAAACQDYAERIAAAGTPSRFLLIPGAHHKFDADRQALVRAPRVQASQPGCPLAWDLAAGQAIDRRNGQPLTHSAASALHRSLCQKTGASLQGALAARETAAQAVIAFLHETLQPGEPAPTGSPSTPTTPR